MKGLLFFVLLILSVNLFSQTGEIPKYRFYNKEIYLGDIINKDSTPEYNGNVLREIISFNRYDLYLVTDSFAIDYVTFPSNSTVYFYPSGKFSVTRIITYDGSFIYAESHKIHEVTDSIVVFNPEYFKSYPQWFGEVNDKSMEKVKRLFPNEGGGGVTNIYYNTHFREGFQDPAAPEGWSSNSVYFNTTGNHGEFPGDYGVGMNATNDWLKTPGVNTAGKMSFWVRGSYSPSQIGIKVQKSQDGVNWIDVASFPKGTFNNNWEKRTVEINDPYDSLLIRFYVYERSSNTLYLDDIELNFYNSYTYDTTINNYYTYDTTINNYFSYDTTINNYYSYDTTINNNYYDTTINNYFSYDTTINNYYSYDTTINYYGNTDYFFNDTTDINTPVITLHREYNTTDGEVPMMDMILETPGTASKGMRGVIRGYVKDENGMNMVSDLSYGLSDGPMDGKWWLHNYWSGDGKVHGLVSEKNFVWIDEALMLKQRTTPPQNASNGMIYYNSDGNLYIYKDTAWRAILTDETLDQIMEILSHVRFVDEIK